MNRPSRRLTRESNWTRVNRAYERGGWIHMVPAGDGHEFAGYWYLMPPGESEGAYLVGYSRADNRRLGFIGTAGLMK